MFSLRVLLLPVFALSALALTACSSTPAAGDGHTGGAGASGPPCAEPRFQKDRFSVQCQQLVDVEGRVVFLRGINARVNGIFDVTFEDGRTALEPIPDLTLEDTTRMRTMGFNALRLPINWSGLEPDDGMAFNEAYLDNVARAVDLASKAGIRVLIDFHQDAYSKEIGYDGAPLWAIKPPPQMLLEGPLTDLDARRKSPQVLAAFSTFFGDSSDGALLRTRFAKAAAHVAQRFAKDENVLGIEIFNEPLPDNNKQLDRLHDEVINAIRAVDPGRVVLFEPSTVRNLLDRADAATRPPWPGTAYAPHIYTLSFSGSDDDHRAMTRDTLAPSNQRARTEAESWQAPLVITEWGYRPDGIQADNYYQWQTELQDQYQASAFFWLWKEQSQDSWGLFDYDAENEIWIERTHVRKALTKVAPVAIAGWPTRFGYDRDAKRFELAFIGDPAITAPNQLFVPDVLDFAPSFTVTCDGIAVTSLSQNAANGLLEVACGGVGSHTLVLTGH
jgi:endoglycosylceramidase